MENNEIPATHGEMIVVLNRFKHQTTQDLRYFNLYRSGLKTLKENPKVNISDELDESDSKKIEKELLSNEIEHMYPNYVRKSIISLFSLLEAAVKDCVKTYIVEADDLSSLGKISKIKISLQEYEQMSSAERYDYLFEMFEREVCRGINYGPKRFEALFLNLDFATHAKFKGERDLIELAQVRNCLLHSGGIVDRSFKAKCEWKKSKIGEPLDIGVLDYIKYHIQTTNYVNYLIDMIKNKST